MLTAAHPARREVEVKYRVGDPSALLAALARAGVDLADSYGQDDQAYAPAAWAYGMSKIGIPFARLRSQHGKVLFTVKVPQANEMDCAEQETVVADRAVMHEALLLMGWVPTVRIQKDRRVGVWADAQVCVDVVDTLGTFVELERMVGEHESSLDVQDRLDRQIQALGVPVQRVTQTYDSLLRGAA
jgi:adenylate cyclase class 2